MLNWMERLIRMRKEAPEIGWGDFTCLETGDRVTFSRFATIGETIRS